MLRAILYAMLRTHRELNTTESQRQRAAARCDGSLLSPLHLAIKRNGFLIMFPPAATWTRAVGLRGQANYIYKLVTYILKILIYIIR